MHPPTVLALRPQYLAPRCNKLRVILKARASGSRNTQVSFGADVTRTVEIPDQTAAQKTKARWKLKWKDSVKCGNNFRIRAKRKLNRVEGK